MTRVDRYIPSAHLIAAFLGVLALAGCGHEGAPTSRPNPLVSTMTVATSEVVLTTELTGRTAPYRVAELRPQVNGVVLERHFEEGSFVEAGDPLYTIDPAPYRAELASARAALARAEANLVVMKSRRARAEELLPDHAVSQQDYDDAVAGSKQAEAEVAASKARVDAARIQLGYTEVRAPISGRIGRSSVTEGAIVTAYQPMHLATIQQLDPIYVDMPQSTAELLRLRRRLERGNLQRDGASVGNTQIILEDGEVYAHVGVLSTRDLEVDPSTGSVVLRAVFPNPDASLLPGMFVRGVVTEGIDERAILVPQKSVARDTRGEAYSWVVDADGLAQMRPLQLERSIDDAWLVQSGLSPGDRLVVEGRQGLRIPGMAVQVIATHDGDSDETRWAADTPATH